jgi:hypothetical protein
MKKLISFLCFLVILTAGSAALATTTTQIWYFDTAEVMPAPESASFVNPYGNPQLKVDPGSGNGWQSAAGGRTGVWSLSGEIDVVIPNSPVLNPYKKITINLIWAPGGVDPFMPDQPLVGVVGLDVPDDARPVDEPVMEIVSIVNDPFAGTPWVLSIYEIIIRPNPPKEWIAIKGDILVDELGIRTECVPEPATIGLLGLGGLALLRSRRKR